MIGNQRDKEAEEKLGKEKAKGSKKSSALESKEEKSTGKEEAINSKKMRGSQGE